MISKPILILSPHRDDEVLGCGGLIIKRKRLRQFAQSGEVGDVHVRYYNTVHPNVSQEIYDAEAKAVAEFGDFIPSTSSLTGVNRLDQIPVAEFISDIEQTINAIKPHILLVPYPSYNQDHRHIYQAARTAARVHDNNFFVPHVWLYEQPETLHTLNEMFVPNVFVPIDPDGKQSLYKLYASQQRDHRDLKLIEALAILRGSQGHCWRAEAFMSLRGRFEDV